MTLRRVATGVALTAAMVIASNTVSAATLWYSRFETEAGIGVTDGQAISSTANSIDTAVVGGTAGTAVNLAGTYLSSSVPTGVDPQGVAGSFAMSSAGDNNWYIDTLIASNTSAEVTLEGFFNLQEAVTSAGHRRIVGQKRGSFNQGRAVATIEYDAVNGAVFGASYTTGSTFPTAYGTTTIQPNVWHHFALVIDFDEGTNTNSIRGYLNGALEFDTGPLTNLAGLGSSNFSLGGGTTATDAFQGYLDEVRISSGALTPDQFLIPEPATLMCLALGGLLMRRSRRSR